MLLLTTKSGDSFLGGSTHSRCIRISRDDGAPLSILDLIRMAPMERKSLVEPLLARLASGEGAPLPPQELLAAPIPIPPRNIICLAKNFVAHAEEVNRALERGPISPLSAPVYFTKATTAITGPSDPIPAHAELTQRLDYEGEVAVIIGVGGRNIAVGNAWSHVFGLTILNDVSARDLQQERKQFFFAKSLDGSAPMGPWITTMDDINEVSSLVIRTYVNDDLRQQASLGSLIFSVPEILADLSRGMTLIPGDIIALGTPAGVGMAMTPPKFLQSGDVVKVVVDQIGAIENRVV